MLDYAEPIKKKLYHHAVKIDGYRYYNVFIIDDLRYKCITEGAQEQAMKKAFQFGLAWLERFVNTGGVFIVVSNAVEIATIKVGEITLLDADYTEELDGVVYVELDEGEGEEGETA